MTAPPGPVAAPAPRPPRIRRARRADLAELTSLWAGIVRQHREFDPLFTLRAGAEGEIRSLLRSMLEDGRSAVFVCERDGEVVGMSSARIDRAPPILREVERAEIIDLAVRRGVRRRGIGRRLAQAALAWVREQGVERVEVRVVAANREGQAFWRALGFGEHVEVLQRSV